MCDCGCKTPVSEYRIVRAMGTRWWDSPYQVTYGLRGSPLPRIVGRSMTRWGARILVSSDRRTQAKGERVVWRGP